MGAIQLQGVAVVHDGQTVLRDVDLHVEDGEVVALLGRSGSGKTSLLRVIAGFDEPAMGRVLVGGRDVTELPSRDRTLGMVAQGAPLHPTRDVEGNLRLPFDLRGENREEGRNRALGEALRFGLQRLLGRRPDELSEGQRATTAMARSVVSAPKALLLDEPAAQLDHQTRARVLQQIGIVQRTRGTTILLVTNSLAVARSIAQRVAVLDAGTLAQVGPLDRLRAAPVTLDVADLVHEAPLARVAGQVVRGDASRRTRITTPAGEIPTWDTRVRDHAGPVTIGLAQEDVELVPAGSGTLSGTVRRIARTGPRLLVTVDTAAGPVIASVDARSDVADVGTAVDLTVHRALVASPEGDVVAVLDRR